MPALDLIPAQAERRERGLCIAPDCGQPHQPGAAYCEIDATACRARASRERRRWRASPEAERHRARAELVDLRRRINRVEAQLDALGRERHQLLERLRDAEGRAAGQVTITEPRAPARRQRWQTTDPWEIRTVGLLLVEVYQRHRWVAWTGRGDAELRLQDGGRVRAALKPSMCLRLEAVGLLDRVEGGWRGNGAGIGLLFRRAAGDISSPDSWGRLVEVLEAEAGGHTASSPAGACDAGTIDPGDTLWRMAQEGLTLWRVAPGRPGEPLTWSLCDRRGHAAVSPGGHLADVVVQALAGRGLLHVRDQRAVASEGAMILRVAGAASVTSAAREALAAAGLA